MRGVLSALGGVVRRPFDRGLTRDFFRGVVPCGWLRWRRLQALLVLAVLGHSVVHAEAASPASRDADKRVLIVATGNVPAGKFVHLQAIAAERGIALEHRYLHKLPADADRLETLMAMVEAKEG